MTTHASGHPPERPIDALLAGYACGTLSAPLHVLVASHLAISEQNRSFVASLEAANGAAIDALEPVPVPHRDDKLAAIFASADDATEVPTRAAPASDHGVLPAPIARYLGSTLPEIRWRPLLPGVKEYKIEKTERGEAVLYWVKPGRKLPHHTHRGSEYTLVLKGGFTEVCGHFRRGDIAIADQEIDHRPVADLDEDCICFAVTDAPLRLTGPVGRILQRLFGKE